MKWQEIAKAKPKFGEDYLIIEEQTGAVAVAHLLETKQTKDGLQHVFTDGQIVNGHPTRYKAIFVALITLPKEKEVTNG